MEVFQPNLLISFLNTEKLPDQAIVYNSAQARFFSTFFAVFWQFFGIQL